MNVCGLREGYVLKNYQIPIVEKTLIEFEENAKRNVFISLPQGTGKTIIALVILSKLINDGKVKRALVLIPRRVLVNQWVDKAQEMFYGLGLIKNPRISKEEIEKIRGWVKYSGAVGVAMTMQSFKNVIKKEYFVEDDFDIVIVDEAADLVISRDFIEGFRMSKYLKGLERWQIPKLFLLPYHISEKKLTALIKKFGEESTLIRKMVTEARLMCTVRDPIVVKDPMINIFVEKLLDDYKKTKANVHRILNKYGIEGYRENIETLLNPDTLDRLKKTYGLDEETCQQIQVLITKYILVQHIQKWFLYSGRSELSHSILSAQKDVNEWLSYEDKKLDRLIEEVRACLNQGQKIYIFSQYVSTAELLMETLSSKLALKQRDITLITGADEADEQFEKLSSFKRVGRILVTTPVFDKGTDIPQADVIIVYTPPLSTEKLFQVVGRIRGGEVVFLAYEGYEEELVNQIAEGLRKNFASISSEK
ncbi:MAG: DEAD/DEAH box helicase family protein [Candidatus Bathyarchaeia archaeon]